MDKRLSNPNFIKATGQLVPRMRELTHPVHKAIRADNREQLIRVEKRIRGKEAPEPTQERPQTGWRSTPVTRTARIVRKIKRGNKIHTKIEERQVQESKIAYFFWHDPQVRAIYAQAKERERREWERQQRFRQERKEALAKLRAAKKARK
jgi:hypothetical protein